MAEYMTEMRRALPAEADTLALGRALAACIEPGLTIYLSGELGAGKTTLARGLLRGLGYAGKVKSPTFTLVEVYEFSRLYLYHFDFYRFAGPKIRPQEFGEAGFREYFNPQSVCLVEWPEKSNQAAGLPAADLRVVLAVAGSGRNVSIFADSEAGARCLKRLQAQNLS
jgi:tRNA threonylcarbamoyladenosine biosynthesis protein TsaE